MLDIIKAHAINNLCYIAAREMVPKGIVVHSTGTNNPYLKRYVDAPSEAGTNRYGNHWNVANPGGRKVCVHAFIGYDKNKQIRVAELLPLDICCWGVGSGKNGSYNYDPAYIQFEICEDKLIDRTYYENAFTVAAEYCAELCSIYGISVDNIVGHCEAYRLGYGSNHGDPEHWMKKFGETMDNFRKKVSTLLKSDDVKQDASEKGIDMEQTIENGDLVSIAGDATYYSGKTIPGWVKAQCWYVKGDPQGDRVVIDKNEKGTNSICSALHKKHLTVVEKSKHNTTVEENAVTSVSKCPYLVKVTADCLYIRKGAGTNTAKVGKITDKGVYTIVEERMGSGASLWGRLKSGAGWISLDYVKK